MRGTAADIAVHAKEILEMRERLNKLYSNHTKQSLERIGISLYSMSFYRCNPTDSTIEKAMERDCFMTPSQALDFGLVDRIVEQRTRE